MGAKGALGGADQAVPRPPGPTTPWWVNLAWRVFEPAPSALDPVLRTCRRAALPWTNLLVRVAEHRGPVHPDGRTGSIVLAGRDAATNPISARMFAEPPERRDVGTVPLWRLRATLARLGNTADLTLAVLDWWSVQSALGSDYLHLPRGVAQELRVPEPSEGLAAFGRSVRRRLRRVLAARVTAEVSHATADFDAFYHTTYVPFARQRYGGSAIVHDFHQLRRAFRSGAIVWAVRDGQRLSGCLVMPQGDVLRLLVVGTAGGDLALEKAGALYALYLFAIRYASREGYRRLDLGQNAPLLSNGVLRHKALWGASLVDAPGSTTCYAVRWNRTNDTVREFLARHPPIFRHGGGLAAVTSLGSDAVPSPAELWQLRRSIALPGLRRLFVILPEAHRDADDGAAPDGVGGLAGDDCELVVTTDREFWKAVRA